jgi:preprotein translocase SecE subunit
MFNKLKIYIQDSRREFQRVNWPTRRETIRLTLIVISVSLFLAFFLGILDTFFEYILKQLLL